MVRQSESIGVQQLVLKVQKDKDKEGMEADVNWMKSTKRGHSIRIHLHPVSGVEVSMIQGSVQLRK